MRGDGFLNRSRVWFLHLLSRSTAIQFSCICVAFPHGCRGDVYREATSTLTYRWSQPLAAVMTTFDFMKQFRMFAGLAAASGG
jgi:hypothetical protein